MFLGSILLVVALVIAFPLYQALHTGGYLFFTNGIDEASYLSYPYSHMLRTWKGVARYSSSIIVWLHTVGLSGGYINILLDMLCAVTFLLATRRALRRYGLAPVEASECALLIFMLPLLTTTWNPIIADLKALTSWNALSTWVTLAPNSDLLFLRSPEPQLSWTILALVIAYTPSSRLLPLALLLIAPFLYTFVRLPVIFVAVTQLLPTSFPLTTRVIVSFTTVGALVGAFVHFSVSPELSRFVVESRAPVLPISALIATTIWFVARGRTPQRWREPCSILVTSTWVGANVQIVSGWMIAPSKFEEYWSAAVIALILSLTIVLQSQRKRLWLAAAWMVFMFHAIEIFRQNSAVMGKLREPERIINLLRTQPERLAFNDVLLATYVDMIHPRQDHSIMSFTRTYDLTSENSLRLYRCAQQDIASRGEEVSKHFTDTFHRLDHGYRQRGVDDVITMGRRPLEQTSFPLSTNESQCATLLPCEIVLEAISKIPCRRGSAS